MNEDKAFYGSLYALNEKIKRMFMFIPPDIQNKIQEIRLRAFSPLSLTIKGKPLFVMESGELTANPETAYFCTTSDIDETFYLLTKHSVFAHTEEIKDGFIKMDNGCRAGICGTFTKDGMIFNLTSINIRIARQFIGCGEHIHNNYLKKGLLILGKPGSGKTTVLRDLIRLMSNENKRVALVDSRGELSGTSYGKVHFDLGFNTDIIAIKDKSKGIEMALRTLFPQIIAFDEIGTVNELDAVKECFNSGVEIITTAHIGNVDDIKKREVVLRLIKTGAVEQLVLLSENIGEKPEIIKVSEII